MGVLQLLEQVVGEQAVAFFLIALGGLVAVGCREDDHVAGGGLGVLGLYLDGSLDAQALVVTVHAAETGVDEHRHAVKSQTADGGVEIVEGNALMRLGALHVGGQQIGLVVVVEVGGSMTGIIDDESFEAAVGDLVLEPVPHLLLEHHVLGGVFDKMYVLGRDAQGFLAIF